MSLDCYFMPFNPLHVYFLCFILIDAIWSLLLLLFSLDFSLFPCLSNSSMAGRMIYFVIINTSKEPSVYFKVIW